MKTLEMSGQLLGRETTTMHCKRLYHLSYILLFPVRKIGMDSTFHLSLGQRIIFYRLFEFSGRPLRTPASFLALFLFFFFFVSQIA